MDYFVKDTFFAKKCSYKPGKGVNRKQCHFLSSLIDIGNIRKPFFSSENAPSSLPYAYGDFRKTNFSFPKI